MADAAYYRDIKFVDDHPSSSDEFRGQPHQRVADTLVSILTSGEGGRAIGLEGTWGSGKSTVIDIARSQLRISDRVNTDDHNHTFFVFDAWAHQSDPLRRVFLQELIQCLDSSDAVDKAYWNEQLEKLETLRKKTTETKAEKLSAVAKAAVITVPFLPIAYSAIAYSILKQTNLGFTIDLPYFEGINIPYWTLGVALVLFPFIVAIFTWLTWRDGWYTNWNFFSKAWWRTKASVKGKSIIWAFTRQTDHVTTEQLIREEEATTVEFNAIFDELMIDAAKHNHRVIIVFDNLDRLPPDLIQSAWATMRNFFATTPGTPRQTALKNVWLIVPFDRVHIEAVFGKDKKDDNDEATPGFIEKTFEIVLRVSPPILSNWGEFLSTKLRECFGATISDTGIYQIFKIFDHYHRLHPKTITPRTIKAFVNTIAAQAKQWGKLIPIEHQALYALYKDEISKSITTLQDSTILDESVASQITDPNWAKSLAAAHYNVGPDEALEILLMPEIEKAIRENDVPRLTKLQETSGFPLILDDCVSQFAPEWSHETLVIFFDAAATLDKLSLKDEVVKEKIWRTMLSRVTLIDAAILPTARTALGLEALIRHSPLTSVLTTAHELVRALSTNYPELPTPPDDVGKMWYSLFVVISDALPEDLETEKRDDIFSAITIQANIDYLFAIAEAADASGKIPFSVFRPSDTPEDIATNLVTLINTATPPQRLDSIINSFILNPVYVSWAPVVAAIQARLQVPTPPLSAPDAYRLLTLCSVIAEKEETAKTAIKALNDDGSLHGILGIGRSGDHPQLVALVLHELLVHHTDQLEGPGTHPHYGSLADVNVYISEIQTAPKDEMLINDLAQRAIKAHRFHHILTSGLPNDGNREIYRAILLRMVELGTYAKLYPLDVLTNTTRIAEILGPDLFQKFLKKFDHWNIAKEIAGDEWTDIDPQFIILSHDIGTKHYRTTIDTIRSDLTSFTIEQWVQSLTNEDNALNLLFTLMDLREPPKLKEKFFDALKSHTHKLIEGAELPTHFPQKWPTLTDLLPPARRRQFFKWLRDRLIDKGPAPKLLCQIFDLFGTKFTSEAGFPTRPEDVIRVIIDPILADGSDESLTCVETHAQAFKETLDSATDAEKKGPSDRLTILYQAGDDDKKSRLDSLATTLGLTIEKPEPPTDIDQNPADLSSDSDSSKSDD